MTPENLQNVALPDDIERRLIFYWLKRISSYTAWQRIQEHYLRWAEAMERSVAVCENDPVLASKRYLPTSDLVAVLKGVAFLDTGLAELQRGNKRVFRFNGQGKLKQAGDILGYWGALVIKALQEEIFLHEDKIPFWNDLEAARADLACVWGECGPYILEGRYSDDPAPVMYGHPMETESMVFPDPLPELPIVREERFVDTDDIVPCSGIWEPVHVEKTKGFVGLFQRPIPVPSGDYAIAGCMNYLHGGSLAPKVKVDVPDDILSVSTTWRLLWRDDRYEDGTIPEEEQFYVFQEPEANRLTRKTTLLVNNEAPAVSTDDFLITARSGAPAPRAGFWSVQETQYASIEMAQGGILPQHEGRDVTWIWHHS